MRGLTKPPTVLAEGAEILFAEGASVLGLPPPVRFSAGETLVRLKLSSALRSESVRKHQ
jgi:hypothetical protein